MIFIPTAGDKDLSSFDLNDVDSWSFNLQMMLEALPMLYYRWRKTGLWHSFCVIITFFVKLRSGNLKNLKTLKYGLLAF